MNSTFLSCPHQFVTDHYCHYIYPAEIEALLTRHAQNADDLLFQASLITPMLLEAVLQQEYLTLEHLLINPTMSPVHDARVRKSVRRCRVITHIAADSLIIAHPPFDSHLKAVNLSVSGGGDQTHQNAADTLRHRWLVRSMEPGDLKVTLQEASEQWEKIHGDITATIYALPVEQRHVLPFEEVIPLKALFSLSHTSLAQYHPQTQERGHGTDEWLFITVHQCFEIWLIVITTILRDAISALMTSHFEQALASLDLASAIFAMLTRLFEVIETISTADYALFRSQLRGSGAESINYRKVQAMLDMMHPARYRDLQAMDVMTDAIAELTQQTSIKQAFWAVLTTSGIIEPQDDQQTTVRKIAKLFVPTAINFEQRHLTLIIEALLRVAQAVKMWEAKHVMTVQMLIGDREILTIGDLSSQNNHSQLGGLNYLKRVLAYPPLFPELWAAVSYV